MSDYGPSRPGEAGPKNPPLFFDFEFGESYRYATEITLRDLFAAAALQGMLARSGDTNFDVDEMASDAHDIADAMLARREKKEA